MGSDRGLLCVAAPEARVTTEDAGIGPAEAVDALLDVPDEETVGVAAVASQATDNPVLRAVDVLVFVDKNQLDRKSVV